MPPQQHQPYPQQPYQQHAPQQPPQLPPHMPPQQHQPYPQHYAQQTYTQQPHQQQPYTQPYTQPQPYTTQPNTQPQRQPAPTPPAPYQQLPLPYPPPHHPQPFSDHLSFLHSSNSPLPSLPPLNSAAATFRPADAIGPAAPSTLAAAAPPADAATTAPAAPKPAAVQDPARARRADPPQDPLPPAQPATRHATAPISVPLGITPTGAPSASTRASIKRQNPEAEEPALATPAAATLGDFLTPKRKPKAKRQRTKKPPPTTSTAATATSHAATPEPEPAEGSTEPDTSSAAQPAASTEPDTSSTAQPAASEPPSASPPNTKLAALADTYGLTAQQIRDIIAASAPVARADQQPQLPPHSANHHLPKHMPPPAPQPWRTVFTAAIAAPPALALDPPAIDPFAFPTPIAPDPFAIAPSLSHSTAATTHPLHQQRGAPPQQTQQHHAPNDTPTGLDHLPAENHTKELPQPRHRVFQVAPPPAKHYALPNSSSISPAVTTEYSLYSEHARGPGNGSCLLHSYDAAVAHILSHWTLNTPPPTLCLNCFSHHALAVPTCPEAYHDYAPFLSAKASFPPCRTCGHTHAPNAGHHPQLLPPPSHQPPHTAQPQPSHQTLNPSIDALLNSAFHA